MTKLLDDVIAQVRELPEREQAAAAGDHDRFHPPVKR